MKKLLALSFLLLAVSFTYAQKTVSGTVSDSKGTPLPGVNVVEKGTFNGINTDANGKFALTVKDNAVLVFSFVGFSTNEVAVDEKSDYTITLTEGTNLQSVTVVGSRTPARTNTSSALPIDVIASTDITSSGQNTFDKALQYRVPSFNTVQTPVNDATSLLDPYEIRNMGPSRTLILINGKRKNLSSLLYVQTSPGRGETGADLSAIPMDAIKRVEILRDGASAQYGSDAIAGVMNIVLKDDVSTGSVNLKTGITSKGDGEMVGISYNNGSKINEKGFINYTIDLSRTGLANRPGKVSAKGEMEAFGLDKNDPAQVKQVEDFLKAKPDAGNINGSPENSSMKFLVNGGVDVTEKDQVYFNAAYINKRVNSFANYRTPYWQPTDLGLLTDPGKPYVGYGPTFQGVLADYNATLGFKSERNGWNLDVSFTTGGNQQLYTVSNTLNFGIEADRAAAIDFNVKNDAAIKNGTLSPREVRAKTPTTFHPGGARFRQDVGNFDASKVLNNKVSVGFGTEFRSETFEVIAGDEESYIFGGADSYAGNVKVNSFTSNRHNIGGYADVAVDLTKNFLINGTVRAENYSDFGNTVIGKFSTRYKFIQDKITLRGSASTGFRAPSLHQIYTQKSQYSFSNGTIEVQGLLNNVSAEANALGVPKLKPEKSTNFTLGLGIKPSNNFSVTVDYYSITLKDRVVLSNTIVHTSSPTPTELDNILNASNIKSLSFFVNGLDTRTSGLDFVMTYRNFQMGSGRFGASLSGNYTLENKRIGDVKNPSVIQEVGQTVINGTQEALMFTSRPKFKGILGLDYEIKKFTFGLYNTVFGPTEFRNAGMDENLKIKFMTKLVTDLAVSYQITKRTSVGLNINNIFNVLPEWKFVALNSDGEKILNDAEQTRIQSDIITFSQRYAITTYDGSHFSQLGTIFNLNLIIRL